MRFQSRLFGACAGIAVLWWAAGLAWAAPAGPPGGRPLPLVAVKEVVERQVRNRLNSVGTVLPLRTSVVSSEIEGRIKSAPVKEGDFVEAGKTAVAVLKRSDLELALRIRQAEFEKARQDYLRLKRGSRPEEVAAMRARLQEREAIMKNDKRELKRAEDLYKRQILDRANYDRAYTKYQGSRNLFIEAQNNLRLAEIGPRQEEIKKAEAEVQRMRAQVDQTEDELSKTVIRSPLTGLITEKWVEIGQWVQKGGRVVEVMELSEVLVRTPISEKLIDRVKPGDDVRVTFDALSGRLFKGKVRNIIPKADTKSRTFPVEVILKNTPHFDIKAGMFARLTMEYGKATRAVLVPKDAILLRTRGAAVFVFDKGKVREVTFTPGRSVDSYVEAPDGVFRPGTKVVVQGNENLRHGMPVRLRGQPAPSGKRGGPPRSGGEG